MKRLPVLALLVVCSMPAPAAPQAQIPVPPPQNEGAKSGFRAEFLANLADVEKKVLDLANRVPEEKYSWRPGAGVRSIGEVFMHIAGGNYFLATFLGKQPPTDIPKDLERVTEKAKILGEVRRSFEHLRAIVNAEPEADLEKTVKMFDGQTSRRGVYIAILNHVHEHLGQSIAYARMNAIVPPWSR